MTKQTVKILRTDMVTHNVKRFVVQKPDGFSFIPGQATDVSINRPGLEDELRPFTFTSESNADFLEFIIKIYGSRDGITRQLGNLDAGDELILHDVFGTITFQGEGLFIAGGAGITPFISIFRDLKRRNKLEGNRLIFVNRTMQDVILKDELEQLLGEGFINIVETSSDPAVPTRFIDRELIRPFAGADQQKYYICGPDSFNRIVTGYLLDLGVAESQIILES